MLHMSTPPPALAALIAKLKRGDLIKALLFQMNQAERATGFHGILVIDDEELGGDTVNARIMGSEFFDNAFASDPRKQETLDRLANNSNHALGETPAIYVGVLVVEGSIAQVLNFKIG